MLGRMRFGALEVNRNGSDPAPREGGGSRALTVVLVGLLLVVASACGSTADPCADVSVAECEVHGYEASCGGSGEPTVACTNDRCVLFATACVPDAYRVVECPLSDLCCEEVDGAPWPWGETSTSDPTRIAHDLALIESLQAADSAWPIEVVVSPDLAISVESVTCNDSTEAWCMGRVEWSVSADYVTYRLGRDLGGEGLLIEISGDRARALSVFRFDVSGGGGAGSCEISTVGRYVPATGSLVLSAAPASGSRPSGRLTLTFEDGSTLISELPSR